MATTITASFQALRQNLEHTDIQQETLAGRQANVREALRNEFTVVSDFLTGSYARKTIIGPLNKADIDIFVVLDSRYFQSYNNGQNSGQAGLLDHIKRILRRTYVKTPDISRNGQAVSIQFSDFIVDVVPGFNRQGGGYLIPNSISSSWISTDPRRHVEIVANANATHGGSLVPLIKMIKCWNRNSGSYFRSFHLEVIALEVLRGVTIADFPSGMRYFFDKARAAVAGRNPDPAGYGDDVGAYINTELKIQEAVAKFQSAYDRSIKAEAFAARGSVAEAATIWAQLIGGYFPNYG